MQKFSGNIVDILNSRIYPGAILIKGKKIAVIVREENKKYENYLIPGLIDSHIHIESSMLPPAEFARIAVSHGTVAAVCDPHEIANVLGVKGVEFMIANGKKSAFKFYFSAPSCVPATVFETSGARLGPKEIEKLCRSSEIANLGEVMNFPGVINGDKELLKKIKIAKKYHKPIDGHAPGLSGNDLKKYAAAGISTDHECFSKKEALEKIFRGMKIQIREGSAVKNFDDLISLAGRYFESCMLCSDDKHPDELVKGHIDDLVRRALKKGIDKMKILRMACFNPVFHYGLKTGLLRKGDPADFLEIDNFKNFKILKTVINGQIVAKNGRCLLPQIKSRPVNNFKVRAKKVSDFSVAGDAQKINVIEAIDGQLITKKAVVVPKIVKGKLVSDTGRDILKIAVVNRYREVLPAVAFIKNFGLKKGAIASSVAHDSHNIVVVGVSDADIRAAVNLIIKNKGGICAVSLKDKIKEILPLPIAGLMSNESGHKVAKKYSSLNALAKKFGSRLHAPFMTLSFMALLVIPEIKLSDQGLFDGKRFKFIKQ